MSTLSSVVSNAAETIAAYNGTTNTSKKTKAEEEKLAEKNLTITKKEEDSETTKKVKVSGRTVGNPELSEKAAKYYEELKRKYGNMNFILVSKDQKEFAKANAAKYGKPNQTVVLIDEEKIERMAEDEKYRKQYEGIIAQGASGLNQLKNKLASMGLNVKTCGIKVNDNGAASFFATMDKSFKAQNKKIQQRRADKKAAKKAEDKKAQKKKQEEKLKQIREDKKVIEEDDEGEITFMADSIDELLEKIGKMDYVFSNDSVRSDEEKQVGQQFDFSV